MIESNQNTPQENESSKEFYYDASLDYKMEERAQSEFIRDESKFIVVNGEPKNPIKSYKFRVFIRDSETFEGELSREEMNLIYNLYSNEGSNLTQRAASRYFPHYTFRDFKRILRAFNITKDCVPFAPHIKEERSYTQMEQLYYQNKDNNFLKKLEQNRYKKLEEDYNNLRKQHKELKDATIDFSLFLKNLKFDKPSIVQVAPNYTLNNSDNTIILYLSDMHIGADVSQHSIYSNTFNYEIAKERLSRVVNKVITDSNIFKASNIVVCNLGDSLDGMDGQTVRKTHPLPQNMNNKEQFNTFIKLIVELFDSLASCGKFNNFKYISVEGGNHN